MIEANTERMQELAPESKLRRLFTRSVGAVHGIPHDRMARVLHMHANLMGAPGEELALDEGVSVITPTVFEALQNAKRGDSLPGRGNVPDGHARAFVGAARDGCIDHAGVMGHDAVNERDIASVDGTSANILHKGIPRRI